nr:OTU domain-containing protein 5-B-like [Tanacetum cinerariifolium]
IHKKQRQKLHELRKENGMANRTNIFSSGLHANNSTHAGMRKESLREDALTGENKQFRLRNESLCTDKCKDQVKAEIKARQDQQIDNALLAEACCCLDVELNEKEIKRMVMEDSRGEYIANDKFKHQLGRSESLTYEAEPSSSRGIWCKY